MFSFLNVKNRFHRDLIVSRKNKLIVFYIDGKKEPFLSSVLGTITKLYIHEWDILSYG
jgi:hypothetical protein